MGGLRASGPFVVLVGESGVGKSTVGVRLASKLSSNRVCRDDFDYGWRDVYPVLDRTENAVVECVKIPRALARRMDDRSAVLVELTLDNETRRKRLEGREVDPDDIDMLFRKRPGPNAYDRHIEPDMKLDTSGDPSEIAAQIAGRVRRLTMASL